MPRLTTYLSQPPGQQSVGSFWRPPAWSTPCSARSPTAWIRLATGRPIRSRLVITRAAARAGEGAAGISLRSCGQFPGNAAAGDELREVVLAEPGASGLLVAGGSACVADHRHAESVSSDPDIPAWPCVTCLVRRLRSRGRPVSTSRLLLPR